MMVRIILKRIVKNVICTTLSFYSLIISHGEHYLQIKTVAAQKAYLENKYPKPSRQLTPFGERLSSTITITNTLRPIFEWSAWSAGEVFLVYNALTKWALIVFVIVMTPVWNIVNVPMDNQVQKSRLVVEFEKIEEKSPYSQLRGEDDNHLRLLSTTLIGVDTHEFEKPFNRYNHIITCTLIGVHFHRHVIADRIFCRVHASIEPGSLFARCITLFCFNMGLNNYANAYLIFSEDVKTSATNWELLDFSGRLERRWNSPVTMFGPSGKDDQSIYQQIIQSLYVAFEQYAKDTFDVLVFDEIKDIFGNTSTTDLFAHLVCMVYDHSVTHRMYHNTGLSAFRKGLTESILGDPDIAQIAGLLVDKTTCTIEANLGLLPNSTELTKSIRDLDTWIVNQRPDAPWLHILSAAGSFSN
jgi:hypothetical protein